MELISVIVPVYNVKAYLRECVESILCQTYSNLEIILVDDGSTDGSGELCDVLAEADSRIRVIHQRNGGLSAARNTGAAASTGAFLCFVDSDDAVAQNYVQALIETQQETAADVVWCGFQKFWDKRPEEYEHTSGAVCRFTKEELWRQLAVTGSDEAADFIVAWTKIIRRAIAVRLTFPVGKWHEDEFYIHRLLDSAESFAKVEAQLYYYRQRPDSIVGINRAQDQRHLAIIDAYEERVGLCRQRCGKEIYCAVLGAYRNTMVIQYHHFRAQKELADKIRKRYLLSWVKYPVSDWKGIKQGIVFSLSPQWFYKKYWNK